MLIGIDGNEANIAQRVGSNIYAFQLIKAIEKIDLINNFLIYLRQKPLSDLPRSRKNFNYRVIPPKFLWTRWRLPLDLALHQPKPNIFFTPGHYAPKSKSIPSVISILDLSFLKFPKSFKPRVLNQLKNWTKQSAKQAAHIFTISEFSKQDIIDNYQIPENKITVTYPSVSQEFTQKISPEKVNKVLKKYKLNKPYILFLGTRQPKKNVPRLIEAFTALSPAKTQLVLAGKTWHQFTQETTSKSSKNIIELGYIKSSDLPALMKKAQGFVLPSLYEGFGIPVLEAMTVGTPVLVSNSTSLPEIVEDAGILVNPQSTDSIARGLGQLINLKSEKRVKLIKAGKKQAKKFSWHQCAQQTLEVLYEASAKSLRSSTGA